LRGQAIRTLTSPTAVTIHSVFDSDGRRIAEYNEASGALIREYVWKGSDPVAVIEGGVISFVRADHIGRPVFATNSTGTKVWSATYNPFGGVHTSTGALPTARFPGQWFQTESGLHQNWMRDYDPTTGRYLQADPLGLIDGASVYGYAGQSPMMNMDPSGQCFGPWAIACAAAAWGAVSVYVSWLLDPDCYTWQEGLRDFTVGFAFGGFGQAWNAAAKAGAYGSAAYGYGAWSAASRGPGAAVQAAADAARAAGKNPREVGQAAHQALRDWVRQYKPSWFAEKAVKTPTGRTIVPDVRSPRNNLIDLKPNTVAGRVAGAAKAAYYYAVSGWRTRIIYYD
jgi:RHS repeat-associated protein